MSFAFQLTSTGTSRPITADKQVLTGASIIKALATALWSSAQAR